MLNHRIKIPYRLLGYRSLLDLLSSDKHLFAIDLHREPAYVYKKLRQQKRERGLFLDHHVLLNEQEQQNIESSDEHEPLTRRNRDRFDTNVWQTPQLNKQMPSEERNNEETIQFVSNPFLPLPTVRHSLNFLLQDLNDNSSSSNSINCENQYQSLQQRILFHSQDGSLIKYSSGRLNRSISTSTTSLSKTYSFHIVDAYIFLFTVVISFIFLGIYLFKIC
ncbi:hypothetical protein I4U23_021691 [Adineta vaga]|nr:hypothetical protein I4U23_021691 [Adineta vaga]